MPVYSMTGYASAQHRNTAATGENTNAAAPLQIGMELRAVNSRFLDISFKLAEELRPFEPALRELLIARLKRGKLELRATVEHANANLIPDPQPRVLQRLGSVQDQIKAWMPSAPPLTVSDIMRLCAVDAPATQDLSAPLLTLAESVLQALLDARRREGDRLAAMLLGHIAQLRTLAQQAGPLVPQVVEASRQRFLSRWKDAMAQTEGVLPEAAQERALTEATAFAIRIDVAEELTRLGAHLEEIERLINKGGEVGKRLDFLIQELHREANTLGSKSAALELTRLSVDMKVLIEQMREQVQNLE